MKARSAAVFAIVLPLSAALGVSSGCGSSGAMRALDDAGRVDAGPPPCPQATLDGGEACAFPGQVCQYANGTPLGLGCYCVGPERIWMCCYEAFNCGTDPTHPNITVGSPCCPGNTEPGASFSCGWCFDTDVLLQETCSVDDPHWRQSETTCNSIFFDGGGVDSASD